MPVATRLCAVFHAQNLSLQLAELLHKLHTSLTGCLTVQWRPLAGNREILVWGQQKDPDEDGGTELPNFNGSSLTLEEFSPFAAEAALPPPLPSPRQTDSLDGPARQ